MDILDKHNEWEPKEVTLDYKVYKDLLNKVVSYPEIMKNLVEAGTHILLKRNGNSARGETDTYVLIKKEDFNLIRNQFNP